MTDTERRMRLLSLLAIALCTAGTAAPASAGSAGGAATVDGARVAAADAEPQNWLAHGRTYDEQRFSPLTQINDKNVKDLGIAWYFDTVYF